ncbi:MAG: hypothetical protein Q7J98_02600 [Kiritimatiellia bacterium]|nr:hypothetical protein [Kiritimatiellia bacterium]
MKRFGIFIGIIALTGVCSLFFIACNLRIPPVAKEEIFFDFSGDPGLVIERNDSGRITGAKISIPSSEGRDFSMEFDMLIVDYWYYHGISVSLVRAGGDERVGFGWDRGDNQMGRQEGLGGSFSAKTTVGKRGYAEVPGVDFLRERYRIWIGYEKGKCIRTKVSLLDEEGMVELWSSEMPVQGEITVDSVLFGVRAEQDGSEIRWDSERQAVYLQAVGAGSTLYRGISIVDNLKIIYR